MVPTNAGIQVAVEATPFKAYAPTMVEESSIEAIEEVPLVERQRKKIRAEAPPVAAESSLARWPWLNHLTPNDKIQRQ